MKASEPHRLDLGDEGRRILRGRERTLFPRPVCAVVIGLLWTAVAITCVVLVLVVAAGGRVLG